MAKKSNKTEHVLKLITKNDESAQDDDFFVINQEISAKGTSSVREEVPVKQEKIPKEILEEIEIQPETAPVPQVKEVPVAPVPQVKEVPIAPVPQEIEQPTLRAFKEQESTGSAILEQNDNLVNIADVLAREKLALVMKRMKVCTCKICVNDVLALALNSLPTKYVTTDAGKQYFQLDIYKKQYETDILAALTKACVRVKAAPRH